MNKDTQKVMFSSKSREWETPPDLYKKLDDKFRFTLDVCATKENTKCSRYFTIEDNALLQDWRGNSCFMNPPYGREIKQWVEKAFMESLKPFTFVVCLLPARTDTSWWHDYVIKHGIVQFLRGRIKFWYQGKEMAPAPFPSAIVIFPNRSNPRVYPMDGYHIDFSKTSEPT